MKSLFRLNKYFIKHKKYLLLGTLFVILSNLFGILSAPLVREALDRVISGIPSSLTDSENGSTLLNNITETALIFGLLILASALIKGIFMYFMRQTLIVMSRYIEYDLKNDVFKHYQSLDATFYGKNHTGDLMNRISEDVTQVRMYVGPALMYTINILVLFIIVIGVMFSINPTISMYVLLPLPLLSFSIYFVSDLMNKRSDKVQSKLSDLTSFVQDIFSGIRVIKAYAGENQFEKSFKEGTQDYRDKYMNLVQINALFFPLTMMLVGVSVILTIYVGGNAVINGTFTFGNIAEFVIYVNMLTWPVASLGWVTSIIQRAAASQSRINEFLDTKVPEKSGTIIAQSFESLEFKNVSFTYPGAKHGSLFNISFIINKNDTLGIIGAIGSGKSTIAKLILNLYENYDGEILLNGISIHNYTSESYRELLSSVSQDVFLFSDTIRANVLLGTKNNNTNHLKEVCSMAEISTEIERFPNKYETILGERGISLSGGQKQRITLARAFISMSELIIIDDGFSAVDTQTEAKIKQSMKEKLVGVSTVFISHRISSIENANTIIVLRDGRIEEKGNAKELLQNNGLFKEMHSQQMNLG